jgi:hypothetical protein
MHLFPGVLQTVEDGAGVGERPVIAAVDADEREQLPEEVPGIGRCRHRRR